MQPEDHELDLDPAQVNEVGPRRSLGARSVETDEDLYWDEYFPINPTATRFNLSVARVIAVMVTRNAERWLPRALKSLKELKHRPDAVIVVDNESSDQTPALLEAAVESGTIDHFFVGDAAWGFGQAVASGLAQIPPPDADDDREEWLWLLHDDVVLASDSLSKLIKAALRGVNGEGEVDILGPKLLQANRRGAAKQISEMGQSITATAARALNHEPGEIDQGQHEAEDVLGVSTCGIFVRRTAWDKLGGFDPAVPLFRDGVEFGWRAHLAGFRVRTCPESEIVHQQVGRAGLREGMSAPATVLDRMYGMVTVAAHRRGLHSLAIGLRLILHTLARALGFLMGKAPSRARDELRALAGYLGAGHRTRRLRKRISALRATPKARETAQTLRPTWRQAWRKTFSSVARFVGDAWAVVFGSEVSDTSLDDLTGDDFAGQRGSVRRPAWLAPTMLILLGIGILTFVAGRGGYGNGHLVGPQLLPVTDRWIDLWRSYVEGVPGAPGVLAPPWVGLAALASLVTVGQPEWLLTALWFVCVPASSLFAWWFFRRLAVDPRARLIGALVYGALPATLGALNRGDLTVIVWALVLPLLGLALLAWRRRGLAGFESWRNTFATALALSIMASFAPAVLGLATVAALASMVVIRRLGQVLRAAVAVVIPVVVISPWIPTLVRFPGRLLTGADPALVDVSTVSTLGLVIGRTPGAGLPPLWLGITVFALVWVIALIGCALRPRVTLPWLGAAALGFATAVGVTRTVVAAAPTGNLVRPSATPWLLLAFGGLISCAVLGFDAVGAALRERDFGLTHLGALGVLLLAVLGVLGSAAWWVVGGANGPVHRTNLSGMPPVARQAQLSGFGMRTLVIDMANGSPVWELSEDAGPSLGDTERGIVAGGSQRAREEAGHVVASLASRAGDASLTQQLVDLGVAYVVVRHAPSELLAAISSTPGLTAAGVDERIGTWRVTGQPGRAMLVVGSEGRAIDRSGTMIEAGPAGRYLVLAEPADPRWEVTLDGKPLEKAPLNDDWRARYLVGEDAGTLRYRLKPDFPWWAWTQFVGLVVLIILSAPTLRRLESRDPAQFARRASRIEPTPDHGAPRKERTQ